MPYVGYSESVVDEQSGVVLYDPERAYEGFNFYCTHMSGRAFLLDMDGHEVHRWILPPQKCGLSDHAILLDNGDLMALKCKDMIRLTWYSRVIWEKTLRAHHDVTQLPDGSFLVLVWEDKIHRERKVAFDAIVHMTADGEEINRWSTHDHLAEIKRVLDTRSFLDTVLDSLLSLRSPESGKSKGFARKKYDYFHMNTISLLPATVLEEKRSPFREGNLLVCFRNVNQIAVLERDTYGVLWAWGEGELEHPHHPTMLPDGHILIFDNGVRRKYSRVVELDPLAETIVWEYIADPPKSFFSRRKGSRQRLPNGNTLICESDRGRAFEVTPEGGVVWEWLNPIPRSRRREYLYRMLRLPTVQGDQLLLRRWWWE